MYYEWDKLCVLLNHQNVLSLSLPIGCLDICEIQLILSDSTITGSIQPHYSTNDTYPCNYYITQALTGLSL